jgi:hypothetical protein
MDSRWRTSTTVYLGIEPLSWAVVTPEKRKVGGSTPPLPTASEQPRRPGAIRPGAFLTAMSAWTTQQRRSVIWPTRTAGAPRFLSCARSGPGSRANAGSEACRRVTCRANVGDHAISLARAHVMGPGQELGGCRRTHSDGSQIRLTYTIPGRLALRFDGATGCAALPCLHSVITCLDAPGSLQIRTQILCAACPLAAGPMWLR